MTQRAPLFSGVGARNRPVDLLTWTTGLPPGRIGDPVPSPIRDRDIRNPLPKPPNLELRFWANTLPPGVVSLTLPQRKTEWPNPVLARQNYELRTWIQTLPPGVISFTIPKAQWDWPNPVLARQNLELRTWIHTQQLSPVVVVAPFVQTDWPNPLPKPQNLELRTWIETLPPGVIALTLPKAQWDWPNPTLARAPGVDLKFWSQGLPPGGISLTIPPNQYDWPNPKAKPQNLELRSWIQVPGQPAPVSYPLNQYDWPNPLPKFPNLELRTWALSADVSLLTVLVPNVVGETQAQATTDILAVGLAVSVATDYSDTVAAGLVISQSPVGGSVAIIGDTVLIVISLGPRPAAALDAGRRRRKLTLYIVTVDGEQFEFRSYEAAVAFLRKAQETAQELADKAIAEAVERQSTTAVEIPLTKFVMPEITASTRELRKEITITKRAVATIYDRAIRDAEIAVMFELVRRKQEEDEEIFWLF